MSNTAAEFATGTAICPYLGMTRAGDPVGFTPLFESRCFSSGEFFAISLQHQAVFCLGERHPDCSRFRTRAAPATATERSSRHYARSAIAVLLAIGAGTALSIAVIGNPLAVEPDNPATPTAAAGGVDSTSPAPAVASPTATPP